MFGGLFLKHFYSIYDYDNEYISLGVNTHSSDLVQIKKMNNSTEKLQLNPPKADSKGDNVTVVMASTGKNEAVNETTNKTQPASLSEDGSANQTKNETINVS